MVELCCCKEKKSIIARSKKTPRPAFQKGFSAVSPGAPRLLFFPSLFPWMTDCLSLSLFLPSCSFFPTLVFSPFLGNILYIWFAIFAMAPRYKDGDAVVAVCFPHPRG